MINIQQAVRNNATDVQNYVNEMDDFFSEMKIKDKNPEKRVNKNVSIILEYSRILTSFLINIVVGQSEGSDGQRASATDQKQGRNWKNEGKEEKINFW